MQIAWHRFEVWRIDDTETVPVVFDLSPSGQGRRSATVVVAGRTPRFNAIELVVVEPGATQVRVCEGCGYPHCESGGWIAFRRIGRNPVWLPAWDRMEKRADAAWEYRPPAFLATMGAPVFGRACWERLRALQRGLP